MFDNNDFFNNFLDGLFKTNKKEMLDKYWADGNAQEYSKLLVEIKTSGRKVFRNSEGKHIIKEN